MLTVTASLAVTAPAGAADAVPLDPHCTSTPDGVTCSFDVPPGEYQLLLALGSRTRAADTGVAVEARRTALAPVSTRAGQIVAQSVTVDVRTPESMPTGEEGRGTPGCRST